MKVQQWRSLLRNLRAHFPVAGKVIVRRCSMSRVCGITRFDGRNYYVRIARNQPEAAQVDTLLHEWAHVLAIEQSYRHNDTWGEQYSRIYRAWEHDFTTGDTT